MFQFIQKHKYFLIVIFLALITRLFFLGSSLWHNDAVDFASSAVHLAQTGEYLQAHAPDYPFWVILLALVQKITFFLTGHFSPIFPANCLTALLGVLTIILLYFLVKKLVAENQQIAFFASLALIFHPAFWLYNEIALSDTAAVFLIVLALFFFEIYLKKRSFTSLTLCGFSLTLAGLTRIPNLFFIGILTFLFFVFHLTEKKKIFIKSLVVFVIMIIIAPLLSNSLIYGLIHHWDFIGLMSVSRRVTPSFTDFTHTFSNFFIYSLPLFFILYLIGLIRLIFKKQWYLLTSGLLPTILYFYYFAGWFKNGAFDLDRYLLILAPFIAIGAGIGILTIISYLKSASAAIKKVLIGFLTIIITAHLFLIVLNLFSLTTCEKIKEAQLFNLIFPSTYCQINKYHFYFDDKLVLYQTLNRLLPKDAVMVAGPDEWAYPQFFGNNFGLGQRIIYKLGRTDAENLERLKNILTEHSPIFIPHLYLSANLLDLIEQQNWKLTVLQPSAKIMILKIGE